MKAAPKAVKKPAAKKETFSADERAAMKEAARESKRGKNVDLEAECLAAIAKMTGDDRKMAERLHAIIKQVAPELDAKTWYGMPAYARNGETICFFQNGSKFKYRYATLGFSDRAKLDEGNMWPNAYALTAIGPAEETRIKALLKKAIA